MNTESRAFKSLFYTHYQSLCNYAFKYLSDHDESKDVVQEVLIRFWEIKRDMISDPAAKYYLFTAVRNRCITILRKKIYNISTDELTLEVADEPYIEQPERDVQKLIQEAMDGLPPKCREVFTLSRVENLTYKQIAEKLNISIKTVENQMGKAIKHMREFIKKHAILILILLLYIWNKIGE
ncbi:MULTISPECIES: RNA polymerase sigma-70 factor [unclassified Sphingobacterium]|uniref:RNA polymerase sigma-70 factor n=1 Tax=unclassified Sphingobacterium TaxID=2609468 RepID=UPI00104BE88B|nr:MULTISPECIES: RNA polymerase sigma-70 factor [unclassified Sphingobacterium]MBB2949560.1 RNA polymerase sigma-70 factor (ECF subfamily) [Sphingobacterium sp. JUb56]MCS3554277.1 RNA polymerase sigma-70 factor (ECF subfamily) [Sphingobacterium sp. JUb21]TCR08110.1 RNA polymerase sigma-70 factor (ECF subfamily) [Sphingobacterium sp. JUb20]